MGRESVFERVDRLFDVAVEHFKSGKSNADLPDEIAGIFERWTMAYQIMKKNNHMGRDFIIAKYKVWLFNTHAIDNHKTALEDLYAAPKIGAIVDPVDLEFKRKIRIAVLEKQIAVAYELAKFSDAAKLEMVLQKYLDKSNDPPPIDPNEEVAKTFAIEPVFEPNLLGVSIQPFEVISQKREEMLKKSKAIKDIDYQEISEDGNKEDSL